MAAPVGTIPGVSTPGATTPVGTKVETEAPRPFLAPARPLTARGSALSGVNAETQEQEKILSPDFLSVDQITELLSESTDGIQQTMEKYLNFENVKICFKEAIVLDYYVSGFLWSKGMKFTIIQYSRFMTLLHMLLHNLSILQMSLEDNIEWIGEVMAEIGPSHQQKNEDWNIFDVKQANAIIDYLQTSLFQHYKLYEFLFYSTREEIVIGTEQVIEVVKSSSLLYPEPLEEGISYDIYSTFIEQQPTSDTEIKSLDQKQHLEQSDLEADTSEKDLLADFTIEDIKSLLGQVTDDILIDIQNEINEKLQIQEEAFHARIEKLKKA